MHKLIRFYNQNSSLIWKVILCIVFLFGLIQVINFMIKSNLNKEEISINTDKNIEYNNIQLQTDDSVISGNKIAQSQKEEIKVIDEFITSCKSKDLQKAYDLLTDECKEELYDSVDSFKTNYYTKIFEEENKNYSIENWTDNIYRLRVIDDILSTGKSNEGQAIQDYITIKKTDNSYKLNVNGYIDTYKVDKKNEIDGLVIQVLERNIFMDYEKYTIKVENNSNNDIVLDSKEDMQSMYIEDTSKVKYSSYAHELTSANLKIDRNHTKIFDIKYYSSYNKNKRIRKLVFSDVRIDKQIGHRQGALIEINI